MYLILARFLSGQFIIQLVNVLTGILVLWLLPVSEYAFYVIALLFTAIVSLVGNMGISQAIATLGAKCRDDGAYLGALYSDGLDLSKTLFSIAAVCVLVLALVVFRDNQWSLGAITVALVLAIQVGWLQNRVAMKQAMLNIQHDDKALFVAGVVGGGARLLAGGLCFIWPEATVALIGNFIGALATNLLMTGSARKYLDHGAQCNREIRLSITRFIAPLSPAIIYFAVKDQISILILGFSGHVELIAQVGALGRLGQIIALLMMINPFFIQPYFARIANRPQFLSRLGQVCMLLSIFSIAAMLSSILFPSTWLFILGGHYSGLAQELPIALSGGLFTLIGGTLYTIVISKGNTASQYWSVVLGIASQLAFISINGIETAMDAIYLNLLPAVSYLFLQTIVLAHMLYRWKGE
jgi:O-antigen/teichoic acid export membrane protein